jgi:hypothetical protein
MREEGKEQKPQEEAGKDTERITIKFGKGLVGAPFTAKNGKEYVAVKIPNTDEQDHTPWASFVVPKDMVHDNQYGKGVYVKLSAEGKTTISKPVIRGEKDGKNVWEDVKQVISNTELKAMAESYKEKSSVLGKLAEKREAAAEKTPVGKEPEKKQEKAKTVKKQQER